MREPEGVTIGVLVERLEGVRQDVAELREAQREDHHRLRSVESAVKQMIDAQQVNRRGEERQYRRLEVRVQVLTLAVGFAAIVSPIVVAILTGK